MKSKCEYNHATCNSIDEKGGSQGGAGCVMIIDSKYIILGFDKYHNAYTICSGRRSQKETCYIETIERECKEEFKLDIASIQPTNSNVFLGRNEAFTDETLATRFIIVGGTPIFIGYYTKSEIDIKALNKKIEIDNNNNELPNDQKEFDHLMVFLIDKLKRDKHGNYKIETENCLSLDITKFTYDVITNINLKKDFLNTCINLRKVNDNTNF